MPYSMVPSAREIYLSKANSTLASELCNRPLKVVPDVLEHACTCNNMNSRYYDWIILCKMHKEGKNIFWYSDDGRYLFSITIWMSMPYWMFIIRFRHTRIGIRILYKHAPCNTVKHSNKAGLGFRYGWHTVTLIKIIHTLKLNPIYKLLWPKTHSQGILPCTWQAVCSLCLYLDFTFNKERNHSILVIMF